MKSLSIGVDCFMKKLILTVASIIVLVTVILVALIFLRAVRLPFVNVDILGANHSLTHWIGWIGSLYIFFTTPVYPIVKHKFAKHLRATLNIHIIGNLLAVLLVSVHFAHQVTRPASNYPDLGTGIVLYATMILLVSTGLILYSGIAKKFAKQIHFLHPAFTLTFYTIIIMHIIQGI
jgi:hypothetical protein